MDEKEGNPKCKHSWVYENLIILTNPGHYHRICEKCGRVEHKSGPDIPASHFQEIWRKFHGGISQIEKK